MDYDLLTEEERNQGWGFMEDEDILYLYKGPKLIARFSATGATKDSIRAEIERYERGYGGRV